MTLLKLTACIALATAACVGRAAGTHPAHQAAAKAERSEAAAHETKPRAYRGAAGRHHPAMYHSARALEYERASRAHALAAEEQMLYAEAVCPSPNEPKPSWQ